MKDEGSSTLQEKQAIDSRVIKKSLGSFYTPQHLAVHISNETLNAWLVRRGRIDYSSLRNLSKIDPEVQKRLLKLLKSIRILDPAVGDGAFLLAAADWLNNMRTALGDTLALPDIRSDIVKNSLYGVDLVDQAIRVCKKNLLTWSRQGSIGNKNLKIQEITKIRQGNSLIGDIGPSVSNNIPPRENNGFASTFHWSEEFEDVMHYSNPGFDVILGNPPYGNILSVKERRYILETYQYCVGGGRDGTWNSAAHFIVRSRVLMKNGGYLGFLVPNSVLRVNQFSKTRKFLLDEMQLWKIIDEGSPFSDVTLEMVSFFCEASNDRNLKHIEIESRRPGYEQSNTIDLEMLRSSKVFSIYTDDIFSAILKRGSRNLLIAKRGRDIPKEHVSKIKSAVFKIPYITNGRSVRRYQIIKQQQYYTDDWFKLDQQLRESFNNKSLVATKNYRYPRCVIKPPGMIHGGGIVKITPLVENADIRVLGLILNSRLIRYICERYLTNYSQLTTCLNTGIMEDLPIVLPKKNDTFAELFDIISQVYSFQSNKHYNECIQFLERLSDALVYELYFRKSQRLQEAIERILTEEKPNQSDPIAICNCLQREQIEIVIESIMSDSIVRKIEDRMGVD